MHVGRCHRNACSYINILKYLKYYYILKAMSNVVAERTRKGPLELQVHSGEKRV